MIFIRYSLVGAVATFMHYVVLVFLVEGLALSSVIATGVGTLVGALCAYYGNHQVTFQKSKSHSVAIPRFFLVAVVGIFLNSIVVFWGGLLSIHYLMAQVFATLLAHILTFKLNRNWTFQ